MSRSGKQVIGWVKGVVAHHTVLDSSEENSVEFSKGPDLYLSIAE